jgi:hypothetical protein
MTLVRDMLSAYDQPEQELIPYEAHGGIEDLIPGPVLSNRKFQRRVRGKQRLLRLSLLLKNPGRRKPTEQIRFEQMYFHRWAVDSPIAAALAERCRAESVSVPAAISLAFMQAFRDVRGKQGFKKANTMVNARRFLPRMNAETLFGLAPGVPLWTGDLPSPGDMSADDFWARARKLKANLSRRIDRLGKGLYGMLAALEGMHDKYGRIIDFFDRLPAIRQLTFSNLGRLDLPQQYGEFRLEKIYSPVVMVSPTPANTIVLSSFAGELEIAIISDEQSLPQDQALLIKKRTMDVLLKCMGMPTESARQW